jgi:hypothetical protein
MVETPWRGFALFFVVFLFVVVFLLLCFHFLSVY